MRLTRQKLTLSKDLYKWEETEKPEVETEKVNYKIEKIKDMRIIKVKACKNQTVDVEESEDKEEE